MRTTGKQVAIICIAMLAIAGLSAVAIARTHDSGAAAPANSQEQPGELLTTVSNAIFEEYRFQLSAVPGNPKPDDATIAKIAAATAAWGFAGDLAETPRMVAFDTPIPGIPATNDRAPLWAVPLNAQAHFSGPGANSKNPDSTPYPGSTGTYTVAFYSPATDEVVYAISGERVAH